ncbi:hypothetical protein G443_003546 [Actinoalloteichus cyanogriseus DSM 43889]|uniref:Secreted protein n=1 Tax=Actinoalloteichus caeruleus DSM 43889 TaxID=1120930 RepID=A0ABT1JL87_ACTCY|nr:hypothetical protein [Actinoalloteichus caeruleus DSM 43889]
MVRVASTATAARRGRLLRAIGLRVLAAGGLVVGAWLGTSVTASAEEFTPPAPGAAPLPSHPPPVPAASHTVEDRIVAATRAFEERLRGLPDRIQGLQPDLPPLEPVPVDFVTAPPAREPGPALPWEGGSAEEAPPVAPTVPEVFLTARPGVPDDPSPDELVDQGEHGTPPAASQCGAAEDGTASPSGDPSTDPEQERTATEEEAVSGHADGGSAPSPAHAGFTADPVRREAQQAGRARHSPSPGVPSSADGSTAGEDAHPDTPGPPGEPASRPAHAISPASSAVGHDGGYRTITAMLTFTPDLDEPTLVRVSRLEDMSPSTHLARRPAPSPD